MNFWFILAAVIGVYAVIRAARQQPRLVYVRRDGEEENTASAPFVSVEAIERRLKAENDLQFLKEQIGNLYALLDLAEAEYAATTSVTKQAKFLRQINSINKQIHTAEEKYSKAKATLEI